MAEPVRIPMVECHGGPLDGLITRWPLLDGNPSPSVEFQYSAQRADGPDEPDSVHTVTYLYVDRSKAILRGMRIIDPPANDAA